MAPTSEDAPVRVRAPGKVNLGLSVGARGEDGYHPVVNVLQAVSLVEEVTATPVSPGAGVSVTVSGLHAERVPTDATNLAVRAALLLAEHVGVDPDVHLHVEKSVPVAGGMGGGSADAAAALVACDALWATGLSREDLAGLAALLGADVPFALVGQTAIGTGRGHVLTPVLARGQYHWVLAMQDSGLSAGEVYSTFDEITAGIDRGEPRMPQGLMEALRSGDAVALGAALHNDLEPAAVEIAPELTEPLGVADEAGALGVMISGSGPTVAALARDARHAHEIMAALLAAGVADHVRHATAPVPGARSVAAAARGQGTQGLRGVD